MSEHNCPKCGTPFADDQLVCYKCGTLLYDPKASTLHMRVHPALLHLRRKRERQAGPGTPNRGVTLQIRGLTKRLIFEEGTEIVLGRVDIANPDMSRFDLTPFGGHERGVSREHALMRFRDQQLTVIDLRSANGTLINMNRLEPEKPYVLHDGDELTLGNLTLRVIFSSED